MSKQANTLGPFMVLTFIYFIVGFLTTINGQFQAPLKVAFLSNTEELKNTLTTLIPFFFFLGYLINGSLGGKWVNLYGYKTAIIRALIIMIAGLCMYALSSWVVTHYPDSYITIIKDQVPYGYFVFLFGSFLMGTSAAIGQAAINPYTAAYELPNTTPVQRMNIVTAVNSFGTTIGPFFVTAVIFAGVAADKVSADQLMIPILIIAVCIVITTLITQRLYLPDIEGTRSGADENLERSIWSFSHTRLGIIAIFFYVGTEVSVGVNINLHATELINSGGGLSFFGQNHLVLWGLDLGIPALLATLYWGGLMVGRAFFSFFNNVSPRAMLIGTTIVASVLIALGMLTNNLWIIICSGLCHSVMWSCIFTLTIQGLKKYTSKASGAFMMGVFGGAIVPLLQGALADSLGNWQYTWFVCIICELVMLYYGLFGYKIKDKECLNAE